MVWDFGSPNDTIAEVHLSSATGLQQLKQLGNTGRALSTALAASAPTYISLLGTLKGRVADLARMFGDSELDLVIYWMNLHRKIDVEIFP
jgi:hypothetical protein